MMKKTFRLLILALALGTIGAGAFFYVTYIAGTSVPRDLKDPFVLVPTNATFEQVVDTLTTKGIIRNEAVFRQLAGRMNYDRDPMRSGRYEIQPGWNVIQLIRHLRGGRQAPVRVVLTNERLLEDVAAKVARFIEPDSAMLAGWFFNDAYLAEIGYSREDLMSLFIPNTYEVYWNITAEDFLKRMIREHDDFWEKNKRLAKAKALGMTPKEVYTLASIVEKETTQDSEKPRMAGVYLNRLETGMRLQADPTAVFATRDFNTNRVTEYHLKFDSPYNTYLYTGLPPGPISMASIASIDAVLNAEDHEYIFFCAIGDNSGLHAFAKTLDAHNENVARYRRNLAARGLR